MWAASCCDGSVERCAVGIVEIPGAAGVHCESVVSGTRVMEWYRKPRRDMQGYGKSKGETENNK